MPKPGAIGGGHLSAAYGFDGPPTAASSRDFAGRLRHTSSNAVVYTELPGGQHAFDVFHSPRFEAVVDGVEAFVAWVLAAPQRTPDSSR